MLEKIKHFFKKEKSNARKTRVDKIWAVELMAALLIFTVFLAVDFLIYQKFVVAPSAQSGQTSSGEPSLLRKTGVENAAKKIRENKNFLENPIFLFAKNPF